MSLPINLPYCMHLGHDLPILGAAPKSIYRWSPFLTWPRRWGLTSKATFWTERPDWKRNMAELTKIDFRHRRISQISDFTELIEMLFPHNFNQQHATACVFLELKWANGMVPNLAYLERKYEISRRILQRTRAKLSRLGLIEHVSYLNSRYGGQHGWKLSTRFERSLKQLAAKCAAFRNARMTLKEKDLTLVEFADARRGGRKQGWKLRRSFAAYLRRIASGAETSNECNFYHLELIPIQAQRVMWSNCLIEPACALLPCEDNRKALI